MKTVECPGLRADWLNSWLAAVGLLVLEPRLKLRWTPEPSPVAVLADNEQDPLMAAASAWPAQQELTALPISRSLSGHRDMKRAVTLDVFLERAEYARGRDDSWALSSSVTDLLVELPQSTTAHADLDPPAPRGTTLHDRLMKCFDEVHSPGDAIPASLGGYGTRTAANGLGFDTTRIAALADASDAMVDPVIEVLAFFGLRVLPMRGDGKEVAPSARRRPFTARQRCWRVPAGTRTRVMTWPAWTQPLDLPGVDALLDAWTDLASAETWTRQRVGALSRLGIHAAWETRRYESRGSSDTTRGFASTRVEFGAGQR